jgi:hypothetical protein
VNYPRFKKEWVAYRETYHSVVNDDLAAKTLREKCVKGDAWKMVGHLEDLKEIWDTLDMCYERPEKYMEEALKPILEFRKYRVYDNGYKGILFHSARSHKRSLSHWQGRPADQQADGAQDHREDAICQLEEVGHQAARVARGDLGAAFETYVERKLRDVLNVVAAEPQGWVAG